MSTHRLTVDERCMLELEANSRLRQMSHSYLAFGGDANDAMLRDVLLLAKKDAGPAFEVRLAAALVRADVHVRTGRLNMEQKFFRDGSGIRPLQSER